MAELALTWSTPCAGHEYDMSGVFATNPRDAPGPGETCQRSWKSPCLGALCQRLLLWSLQASRVCKARRVLHGNMYPGRGAVVWRESVVIGETSMGAQEVQEVVQQLGSEYKGTAYHLLERNCNHFSNELCLKLTGRPAPSWVWSANAQLAAYQDEPSSRWSCQLHSILSLRPSDD